MSINNLLRPIKQTTICILFLAITLSCTSFAAKDMSFNKTVDVVQKALISGDLETLLQHVDLNGIIAGKISKYTGKAGSKGNLFQKSVGKVASMGGPVIVKAISKLTISEFSKSSGDIRRAYMKTVKIKKVGSTGNMGYVIGSFMGQPFFASAVKANNNWVITAIESPLVETELRNALKMMKLAK